MQVKTAMMFWTSNHQPNLDKASGKLSFSYTPDEMTDYVLGTPLSLNPDFRGTPEPQDNLTSCRTGGLGSTYYTDTRKQLFAEIEGDIARGSFVLCASGQEIEAKRRGTGFTLYRATGVVDPWGSGRPIDLGQYSCSQGNLKTAYTDELSLGVTFGDKWTDGQWRLRARHRKGEDQFARAQGATSRDSYLTNDGSSEYNSVSLEYSKAWDMRSHSRVLDSVGFHVSGVRSERDTSSSTCFGDDDDGLPRSFGHARTEGRRNAPSILQRPGAMHGFGMVGRKRWNNKRFSRWWTLRKWPSMILAM